MLTTLILASCVLCTEWAVAECSDPDNPPTQCEQPLSFSGGTVWKPDSESDGNLVVILAEQHDYSECQAKRRDGTWETLRYTGRANGNRQHYRGSQPGRLYANKIRGGGVRCDTECFFPIPGPTKERWD